VLEALRSLKLLARFFNASSSEIFGDLSEPAVEENKLAPYTPYGVAKAASTLLVQTYRRNYGLFVCSGIMFNHESPLRPENFVSQRIIRGVIEIAKKRKHKLALSETTMVRDWGWAPDFVECMWKMLQQDQPEDYVIATGIGNSLAVFVERAFRYFDLDSKEFVTIDPDRARPADITMSIGNPAKAARQLGWKATVVMPQLVDTLIEAALKEERDKTPNAPGRA
jgi:GDPmannose 4,6-dehydratase